MHGKYPNIVDSDHERTLTGDMNELKYTAANIRTRMDVKLVAYKRRCQMPFHVSRFIETAAIFCGTNKFCAFSYNFQVESLKFLQISII